MDAKGVFGNLEMGDGNGQVRGDSRAKGHGGKHQERHVLVRLLNGDGAYHFHRCLPPGCHLPVLHLLLGNRRSIERFEFRSLSVKGFSEA